MADTAGRRAAAGAAAGGDTSAGDRAIVSVSPPLRPLPGSGMGSRLVIGQGSGLDALDPFPALMHDDVPPHVMFPMHPHRGVEIVTYALGGALHHEDSLGNAATVIAGGVERNLFGRGYYHSEAPVGGEHYRGLQLFILLSPDDRQLAPSFQLLAPEEVPEVQAGGVTTRVLAGAYGGRRSPLTLRNPTLYLDIHVASGASASLAVPVPGDFQGLVYVLAGDGQFGTPAVAASAHQRLVLGPGETLQVTANGDGGTAGSAALRFVVIAGRPIGAAER